MKVSKILVFITLFLFSISCQKENIPPTCEIASPGNGTEYEIGDIITISVEAEDEDGSVSEVIFYINDIEAGSSSSFPFKYEWDTSEEEEGIMEIKVTAKDDQGAAAEDEISILLNPGGDPPVSAFTTNKTSIIEGESIQFTDQSTNEPTSWSWDFGDGNTSIEQNPSHTYTIFGNYTVSLQVINNYGSDIEAKSDIITVSTETGTFTDARDEKSYNWVKIGTQTWMAENLAYLPAVFPPAMGGGMTAPSHYVYSYNGTSVSDAKATSNYQTYGVLYNWTAALEACPAGWHLPTNDEWETLGQHLGGKLKENGTTHWNDPNEGATNESGFTALPGGIRLDGGSFEDIGSHGYWWSATESSSSFGWRRSLSYNHDNLGGKTEFKVNGISVRCLKD